MAELFLARDTRREGLVVIKRILPYLSQEAEFVQMFLDEARIAAQLHHPNVIEVYELGKLEDSIFIAMEYVDGVDLRKVLAEELKQSSPLPGSIPYGVAAWISARICDGLHVAHNQLGLDGRPMGIIHRDVSPQNVMVGYDGRVKLVDFGIAKANAFMERSKPGVIKGKFLYLAPEQLTQEALDHRADLWALGVMLYEVTTGKSPFYKSTTEAVILAIRNEDPPPPHLVRPDYPLELSRIVMRCLTKDRTRRYAQAGELARDLDAYLSRLAPMDEMAVAEYVASLFGTDGERTMLHIPGSEPKVPAKREGTTPARRAPTLSPAPVVPAGPFGGEQDEPPTQMARPGDLQKQMGRAQSVVAAPALGPVPTRRPTGLAYVAAGSVRGASPGAAGYSPPEPVVDGEGTHTLIAPDVIQAALGERSEASLTPSVTPSNTPPERTFTPPTSPRAPALQPRHEEGTRPERRAMRDEVSSGAPRPWPVTGDVLIEDVRGLRGRGASLRGLEGRHEGDDESTMDGTALSLSATSTTPSGPPQAVLEAGSGSGIGAALGNGRRVIIAALTVAIFIVAVAGAVRIFRQMAGRAERAVAVQVAEGVEAARTAPEERVPGQVEQDPAQGSESARAAEKAPGAGAAVMGASAVAAARAAEAAGPEVVPVVFRAPAGTRITVGKRNYAPNRTYELAPGTERLFYTCPKGYRGRGSRPQTFEADGDEAQEVTIACKRK